ncbi:MAG TPA: glycosyltransferase, partial [Chthoniobacterales bacterium]|nr:glycosyltransferase [Chthoniobacterales bacterium]
ERFLGIERSPRATNKVRLLCVSRLNSQKNLPLLLETVKALRGLTSVPFEVVIVGDGPEEAKLRTHIQREGLDELVTFHPSVSRAEIPSEYANADIFVLTSDYEGYPRVLMEAAAAALPIVTTAISGSDEAVLDGESGFIVPVRARDAIVEKLALLMEDSARRLEMGLRGRRHIAEQLDPALNAPRQLAIWRKTASARVEDKQRLLVFNLATDAADPILAFTTQWIRELAARVGAIEVITMRAGVIDVPPNVRVHSVGKELGYSEPRRVLEFYRHLFRILRAGPVTGCFSHMMPEFSTLAGPVLRARGIPLVTWYAHPSLTWFVRAAHLFSSRIVTSLPNAYPGRRDKLSVIGQGIDTELFQPNDSTPVEEDLILCVGRISRVKGHLTLLRAFAQQDPRLRLVILGTTAGAEDEVYARELRQLVSELGLTERVTFAPALSRAELPAQYRRCAVHVNLTPAGFGDKVAWEAMSCGRPCLVANEDFRETLGEHVDALLFRTGDVSDLADKLRALLEKTPEERAAVGAALRRQVERLHSLPRLADRVLHELRGTAPAPLANPEPELA